MHSFQEVNLLRYCNNKLNIRIIENINHELSTCNRIIFIIILVNNCLIETRYLRSYNPYSNLYWTSNMVDNSNNKKKQKFKCEWKEIK